MYHTCVTILMGENMKNEVVHARVQESVKKDSEKILSRVGISISQAIDLFLRQVILKRGIPFDLTEEENIECDQMEELSYIINSVDGKEPPTWAKCDYKTLSTMKDIYVYEGTNVLINKLNIRDNSKLDEAEGIYVSIALRKIIENPIKIRTLSDIRKIHFLLFEKLYEWAGEDRKMNMYKSEPVLNGLSVTYSDCKSIGFQDS